MNETLDLYDKINTTGVSWLRWNAHERHQKLGIKDFDVHNEIHLWLLRLMNVYQISFADTKTDPIYLQCGIIDFIQVQKYKIKNIKRYTKKNDEVFLIEPELFAREVCQNYDKAAEYVKEIYNTYWG